MESADTTDMQRPSMLIVGDLSGASGSTEGLQASIMCLLETKALSKEKLLRFVHETVEAYSEDVIQALTASCGDEMTVIFNDTAFSVKTSILRSHAYFDRLFGGDWSESNARLVRIRVQDHLVLHVPTFLQYIGALTQDEPRVADHSSYFTLFAHLQLAHFFSMENVEDDIVAALSRMLHKSSLESLTAENLGGISEGPHLDTDRFHRLVSQCCETKKLRLFLLWANPELVHNNRDLSAFMQMLWREIPINHISSVLAMPRAEEFLAKELARTVTDLAEYVSAAGSAVSGSKRGIHPCVAKVHPGYWIFGRHWSCCQGTHKSTPCGLAVKCERFVSTHPSTKLGRSVDKLLSSNAPLNGAE